MHKICGVEMERKMDEKNVILKIQIKKNDGEMDVVLNVNQYMEKLYVDHWIQSKQNIIQAIQTKELQKLMHDYVKREV